MAESDSMSRRGWSNVKDVMPRIQAAVKARELRHHDSQSKSEQDTTGAQLPTNSISRWPSQIDLSTAEDWTVREEMLKICKSGIAESFRAEHFSYPNGFAGDQDLLNELANFFSTHFSPVEPVLGEHIMVAPGTAGCLDTLVYNICDPGDSLLIPAPYWSAFDFILKARCSVEIVPVQVDQVTDIMSDGLLDSLELAIQSSSTNVKALIMCNPQNPLGQRYSRHVIERCLAFCQKHNLHYISDEVYAMTNFECSDSVKIQPFHSILSFDLDVLRIDKAKIHMVWGTSKDFGQSGVRIGALVSQNNVSIRTGAALSHNTTVSSFSAVATTYLLRHPDLQSLLTIRSERLAKSYSAITTLFKKHGLPYIPAYASLYVFVQIAPQAQAWEHETQALESLKRAGLNISGGRSYQMPDSAPGWCRISFSLGDGLLKEAIRRMDEAFSSYL